MGESRKVGFPFTPHLGRRHTATDGPRLLHRFLDHHLANYDFNTNIDSYVLLDISDKHYRMVSVHVSFLALASLAVLAILSRVRRKRVPRGYQAVPGPKGLPLVGNTLQLHNQPQRQFQEWARQYGELFQVQIGWENWVFVNSPTAVKEIFDKQSAITSGRNPMPVISDVISGTKRLLFMSYTPEWRKLRTIVHKLLTPKSSETFKPSQEFEAKQLIYDILDDNKNQENFYMHVRRYTTSVVMTSTYGRRVPVWVGDPRHKILERSCAVLRL